MQLATIVVAAALAGMGAGTTSGPSIAKELERIGLPTAHVCSIITISKTVGANRIVPSVAIPHPLGDPTLTEADEQRLRRALLERALRALETPVEKQRVFA